jgi:hypothetical protein
MNIEIDERAEKHFNEKARDFLYELKPDKTLRQKQSAVESSAAHVFVSKHLTEKDIIKIDSTGYVDNLSGKQIARYFFIDKMSIGLNEEAYAEFDKFIESIWQKKEIRPYLSKSFLGGCAFEWFEKRYRGTLHEETDFISYVKEKAIGAIKPHGVSLPISFLSIQMPFNIGKIRFDYCKRDFCDKYIDYFRSKAVERDKMDENKFKIFETRFRKKYQGTVFASIDIEAEQQRCVEIARLQVEKALTALRFFSPSAFLPEVPSYFGIMGLTHIPEQYIFIFAGKDEIPTVHEGIDESRMYRWHIDADLLSEVDKMGLGLATDLIFKEDPTEFEALVANSIYLFGRSLTSMEFQDKIVYALVSIETLLLQNQTEPIQSSIGLRLAFLTESEPKKRKNVKDRINKAYKFRSSYMHHGKIREDWELLRDLQLTVWTAFRNALVSSNRFKTAKEFLDHLENMILS